MKVDKADYGPTDAGLPNRMSFSKLTGVCSKHEGILKDKVIIAYPRSNDPSLFIETKDPTEIQPDSNDDDIADDKEHLRQ